MLLSIKNLTALFLKIKTLKVQSWSVTIQVQKKAVEHFVSILLFFVFFFLLFCLSHLQFQLYGALLSRETLWITITQFEV